MMDHNSELSLLNVSIKEEPVDDYEFDLDEVTIKEEPKDDMLIEEPVLNALDEYTSHCSSDTIRADESDLSTGYTKDSSVTHRIIINGKEKACVLVNMRQSNGLKSKPIARGTLTVQCPRCKNTVAIDKFRQHVGVCPSRYPHKLMKKIHADPKVVQNEMVSKRVNTKNGSLCQIRKEISESNASENTYRQSRLDKRASCMRTRSKSVSSGFQKNNSLNVQTYKEAERNLRADENISITFSPRRTRSKSCSRLPNNRGKSLDNDLEGEATKSFSMRTRGKSVGLTINSSEEEKRQSKTINESITATEAQSFPNKLKLISERQEKSYHASQLEYYQKFLEIRKKSLSNKIQMSSKGVEDTANKSVIMEAQPDQNNIGDEAVESVSLLEDHTFSCSTCSFTTDKQRSLRKHERHHRKNSNRIFQCVYCNQKYTKNALYLHIQNIHPGQKFQIADEKIRATTQNIHNAETKPFKCSECDFLAETSTLLQEHLRVHYFNEKLDVLPSGKRVVEFACNRCSYTTAYKCDLVKHIIIHSKNPAIIQCSFCTYKSTVRAVKYHEYKCDNKAADSILPHKCRTRSHTDSQQKSELDELARSTEDLPALAKTFKCSRCPFSTNLRIKLNFHVKKRHSQLQDHEGKLFKCPVCSHATNTRYKLDQHMKCHESNMSILKCDACDYTGTIFALRRHFFKSGHDNNWSEINQARKKKSDDSLQFACSECAFSTKLRIKLKIHMENHSKNAPLSFACRQCSFVTSFIGSYTQHIRSHERLPTKTCACGFKATPILFYRHRRQCTESKNGPNKGSIVRKSPHLQYFKFAFTTRKRFRTDVKQPRVVSFHCNLCSVVSYNPYNIKKHMRSHKYNQPIKKCPHCSFKSVANCLYFHMQKHGAKNPIKAHKKQLYRASKQLLKCEKCSYVSFHRGNMNKHRLRHKLCDFESTPKSLLLHTSKGSKQNVAEDSTRAKLFDCEQCSVAGLLPGPFRNHMQTHFNGQPMKQCKFCDFQSTDSCLKNHIRLSGHSNKTSSSVMESLPQALIKKGISRKEEIINKTKNDEVNLTKSRSSAGFSCPACPFSTNLRIKLNVHMKKKHPASDKTVEVKHLEEESKRTRVRSSHCEATNKDFAPVFSSEPQANENRRSEGCDSKSRSVSGLKAKRTKRTLLNCTKCSFTTYFPEALKNHEGNDHLEKKVIKNIGAIKNFQCEYCSFTSYWQYLIDRHVQSHTVLKLPIAQCPKCDFRSTPATLAAHSSKCVRRSETCESSPASRKVKTT